MTSPRVLLIDDDEALGAMLAEYLGKYGLEVVWKASGAEGLDALNAASGASASEGPAFELVVLDVMLPGIDGLEILRRIRGRSTLPVLMLTARGDDTDRIVGLEMGADDYLAKPFNPRELLARLRALVRRQRFSEEGGRDPGGGTTTGKAGSAPRRGLEAGPLVIDRERRQVSVRGVSVPLTGYQFDLLVVLVENEGRVVSRDELRRKARGKEPEPYDRSIDVHVSRIRAAIEDDPKSPQMLLTVRGQGYVFSGRPETS